MRRNKIFEAFSEEWPPQRVDLSADAAKFVSAEDIARIANKSDLEQSWREFVSWIGFSELSRCLARKSTSIDRTSLRLLSENIFSIEIGLIEIAKRWSTLRKLRYPKNSSIYNAYSFVHTCITLARSLPPKNAGQLRARVIAGLLPSGRLADLDLELRIWHLFSHDADSVTHFGVLGEPGPDFIVSGAGNDIEIEAKCISPETGMPLSYGLISPLMKSVSECLRGDTPTSSSRLKRK
jgi:hypothetical protein